MNFNKTLLIVTPASFDAANDLKNAITKAISRSPLKFSLPDKLIDEDDLELTAGDLKDDSIGEMIKVFLNVSHSREVEAGLWACAERAVYDKKDKIDKDFFEDLEHREWYYPIMIEIVTVNVGPFIRGLLSQFGGLVDQIKDFLKSK